MLGVIFAYDGEAGFCGTWSAMTAARGFDKALLNIPQDATHWIRYTGGASAALRVGELLTGNASLKNCRLLAQAIENGVASGSSDAGIILVNSVSGAFLGDTTLTGGTTGGTVTINAAQEFIPLLVRTAPKAALIVAEGFAINFTLCGSVPTVTAGTNYGTTISAGQSYVIRGFNNIRKFSCINSVASSGALLKTTLFY